MYSRVPVILGVVVFLDTMLHVIVLTEKCIDTISKARGEYFQRNRFKSYGRNLEGSLESPFFMDENCHGFLPFGGHCTRNANIVNDSVKI